MRVSVIVAATAFACFTSFQAYGSDAPEGQVERGLAMFRCGALSKLSYRDPAEYHLFVKGGHRLLSEIEQKIIDGRIDKSKFLDDHADSRFFPSIYGLTLPEVSADFTLGLAAQNEYQHVADYINITARVEGDTLAKALTEAAQNLFETENCSFILPNQ